MKLDRIDIAILCELQKNGRVTNTELAKLVDLSPSPCLMRVRKLQAEGYICGYSAQINLARLGQVVTVFTEVTLRNHRQIDLARFIAAIDKLESAIECHVVSGGYDYLVKFVTSGLAEYQTIMECLIDRDVGIDRYLSFVVLKSPIVKPYRPLDAVFQSDHDTAELDMEVIGS
ncbi:Lrp/AsnC family transcriptional regulator [Rhizobium sullae]|uniref:Lrp/AsnC family transcriptional regulator n=1 Tax=Rhizobium sullae TaxID=50338 RepID=A0A2N0DAF4_RHISU|nr:Lrp/AsnC family transcriptional regulator [Rhizobium sullae]PKA43062.1 Lrp/AsnC family transcriptional regulator [Rhizobium sullae]UWU15486.1 Lrp/AsnC family transcriptional regulator [Rhizobium sullae]